MTCRDARESVKARGRATSRTTKICCVMMGRKGHAKNPQKMQLKSRLTNKPKRAHKLLEVTPQPSEHFDVILMLFFLFTQYQDEPLQKDL